MIFKLRKRFIFTVIVILAIAGIAWRVFFNKKPDVEYTTVNAVRGQLLQTVSETGTIKPIEQLDLNFLNPGKVASIAVKIGDKVKQDDVLARLDDSNLAIQQREALANLNVAQARLDKLIAGASGTDIAVAEAGYQSSVEAVNQAQKTYNDLIDQSENTLTPSEQSVIQAKTALDNAKLTYQQALNNKADALLTTMNNKVIVAVAALDAVKRITDDNSLKNYLSILNSSYLINTRSGYVAAADAVDKADSGLPNDSGNINALNSSYNSLINALNLTYKDVNYCFNALEGSIISSDFTQSELDAFKTTISGHSTNVSTAISALQTAKQALDDAKLAYDTNVNAAQASYDQYQSTLNNAILAAKNSLASAISNQKKAEAGLNQVAAKSRVEDINLARAQVGQAQASVELIRNQIDNNAIKAPLEGVITQVNYKVGEQASAAKAAISMIVQNHYEIEIDVSETDIAKVKLDDPASVTIDAFGDGVKFEGKVLFIEPAETVIQGVTYYKVKIDFTPGDKEVKPGMTATAQIKTASRENILMIPSRAIYDKDGRKYVKVLYGQEALESLVEIGLTGDGGMTEVLSGVKEGDQVVTYTKTITKK